MEIACPKREGHRRRSTVSNPDERNDARRPHPAPMAAPYLEFELGREIDQLGAEPEWKTGHNARTLVKYDDLRVVLVALRADARIPEHRADGRVTIHAIRGRVHVRAEGRTFDLPAGALVALDRGVPHDVHAIDDSAILLTI